MNIDTDRYPVINTIQIKLTGKKNTGEGRNRYQKCSEEQQTNINNTLTEQIKAYEGGLAGMGTVVHHPAGQGTWEGAVAPHLPG